MAVPYAPQAPAGVPWQPLELPSLRVGLLQFTAEPGNTAALREGLAVVRAEPLLCRQNFAGAGFDLGSGAADVPFVRYAFRDLTCPPGSWARSTPPSVPPPEPRVPDPHAEPPRDRADAEVPEDVRDARKTRSR
jgi:hypothetical protein